MYQLRLTILKPAMSPYCRHERQHRERRKFQRVACRPEQVRKTQIRLLNASRASTLYRTRLWTRKTHRQVRHPYQNQTVRAHSKIQSRSSEMSDSASAQAVQKSRNVAIAAGVISVVISVIGIRSKDIFELFVVGFVFVDGSVVGFSGCSLGAPSTRSVQLMEMIDGSLFLTRSQRRENNSTHRFTSHTKLHATLLFHA